VGAACRRVVVSRRASRVFIFGILFVVDLFRIPGFVCYGKWFIFVFG